MFNKSKFLAAFLLSVSSCAAAVFAQQTPPPAPSAPMAPGAPSVRSFSFDFDDGASYLGVETQNVTKENFAKFGLRDVRGVAVGKVVENSPAASAGLQTNDVIVRFNGEEVTGVRKLTRMISEVAPDHQVRLTVLRGGSEREITATLGKRPATEFQDGAFEGLYGTIGIPEYGMPPRVRVNPQGGVKIVPPTGMDETLKSLYNSRQIGVSTSTLSKQLGDYFGVADGKGVLVSGVAENSPAAKAGLKAGDVIVEADGKVLDQAMDLSRAINEKKEGDVTLTIIRNKNRQTVKVTPEKRSNDTQLRQLFEREEGVKIAPRNLVLPPESEFRFVRPFVKPPQVRSGRVL